MHALTHNNKHNQPLNKDFARALTVTGEGMGDIGDAVLTVNDGDEDRSNLEVAAMLLNEMRTV